MLLLMVLLLGAVAASVMYTFNGQPLPCGSSFWNGQPILENCATGGGGTTTGGGGDGGVRTTSPAPTPAPLDGHWPSSRPSLHPTSAPTTSQPAPDTRLQKWGPDWYSCTRLTQQPSSRPSSRPTTEPTARPTRGLTPGTVCCNAWEDGACDLACRAPATVLVSVAFASFGTPGGACVAPVKDNSCHADESLPVVAAACLGKPGCRVWANNTVFGDPCFGQPKNLLVVARCALPPTR